MSRFARRTTADLVDELHETAARNDRAALVVGFDDRTEFVWASDPNPLHALNAHVRNGGDPLGVVTDGTGLSSEQMQAVAAEFNLAVTNFVLTPKDARHTAQVRIFTP